MPFFLQQAFESITGKDQAKDLANAATSAAGQATAGIDKAEAILKPLSTIGMGALSSLSSMFSGNMPMGNTPMGFLFNQATRPEEPIDINNIPGFKESLDFGLTALARRQSTRGTTGGREQAELFQLAQATSLDAFQREREQRRAARLQEFNMQNQVLSQFTQGVTSLANLGASTTTSLAELAKDRANVLAATTMGNANTFASQQSSRNNFLTNLAVQGVGALATGGLSLGLGGLFPGGGKGGGGGAGLLGGRPPALGAGLDI